MQQQAIMPEKDMLYTILCDLKRSSREYTTAATESNCMEVRQMFTSLLHSTLQLQGKVYQYMSQQNMYNTSSKALRQEVQKQIQQYQQSGQETQQWVQSKLHSGSPSMQEPVYAGAYRQQGQQNQPYMM